MEEQIPRPMGADCTLDCTSRQCFHALGLAVSEKQIPQLVENIEKTTGNGVVGVGFGRPRQARYQARYAPTFWVFFDSTSLCVFSAVIYAYPLRIFTSHSG